jgi:hypothetical protein
VKGRGKMMNETKKAGAIAQIKNEFMERFGVEVKVDLHIHAHRNPHVTKEVANYICREYLGEGNYEHKEHADSKWYGNGHLFHDDFDLSVFYNKEVSDHEDN